MQGLPRYCYFLAFVFGGGIYAFISTSWNAFFVPWMPFILAALVCSFIFLNHFARQSLYFRLLAFLLVFSIGACISQQQINARIQQQLPEAYQGVDLIVDATVTGLLRDNGRAWVFDAWVDNFRELNPSQENGLASLKGKVRLSWYKDQAELEQIRVGKKSQFQVRLRRPRGLVNPGGFDYQAWLLARSYIATGYIRSHNAQFSSTETGLNIFIHRLRQGLQQRLFRNQALEARLEKPEVLQALLLGEKSDISSKDWHILQQTGAVHLIAISGLHIGLVAGLALFLGRICVRVFPGSALLLIFPATLSIASAGFYAAVAGFSIPTQRALVLVIVFNLAHSLGKRINPFDALSFAAVLVIILDPFAFMSPGFWLSFAAVFLLVYRFGLQRKAISHWRSLLYSQFVVLIGLTVPLAAMGLPTSTVAPFANLVAIPLISFLVVPGLFLAIALNWLSASLGDWVLSGCDQIVQWLWHYFEFLQHLSLPQIWLAKGQALWSLIVIGGLGVLLFLSPYGLRLQGLGLGLLLLVMAPANTIEEGLEVTVLDVGQGLSVVLRHRNFSVVYDTGDRFSANFDVGSRIVLPFLREKRVEQINLLIVSHGDNDHAGGLPGLSQSIAISQRAYGPDLASQARADGGVPLCDSGMAWEFGDLLLKVIHPDAEYMDTPAGDNNLSCTILVKYQGFSLLLPGDIEKSAEYHLLAAGRLPKVDIIVAPHHGSQTSSSVSLLAKTQPELVVFSTGYMNRYGHPSTKVVKRYRDFGVDRLNTAQDGAITVKVTPRGDWQVNAQRTEVSRLWISSP